MTARRRRSALRLLVMGVLAAWAVGLAFATLRLQPWQQELTQVLNQLRADELLRSSFTQRDQVHPDWYRQRAMALLSAVERLRDDTSWSLVMPGSWHAFDDLEERAAARIDRAFSQIVVETIRRELDARVASLSGVGRHPVSGEALVGTDCTSPVQLAGPGAASSGAGLEELPAHASMARHLAAVQELDRAIAALRSLQDPDTADPEAMRMLVRYSLHAELSGGALRSLELFHASTALPPSQLQALVERVRWGMWCTVSRGMSTLHAQWLDRHELLAAEDQLARLRPSSLFEPATSPVAFAASVARLKSAHALIERQARLLSRGPHEWMRPGAQELGPAHERLLQQVAATPLLGAEAAERLKVQAQVKHAAFQRRFEAHFARAGSGLVWLPGQQRYALAPERAALGDGLGRLLEQPFMEDRAIEAVRPAALGAPTQLQELLELVQQRRQFLRESLPVFPVTLRPQVSRYVEDRIGQRAFELGTRFLEGAADTGMMGVSAADVAYQRLGQVESTLRETGSPLLARRTRERLERDVLAPLAASYGRPAPLLLPPLRAD
ncbi:hypothetical protein JI739_11375 [Ramlibacter sp. AW1]|uniref:Uncharacterized protein n=1 Tax=Ramlibacter aurantiacus TaxID=2801330 RepID=A0A936ZP87_9BURK|nr:hypothetical protein [Ramlibacter aurantiacus]MBL0420948.1 hypothetical protein [Ramlibacter aurantiacus]